MAAIQQVLVAGSALRKTITRLTGYSGANQTWPVPLDFNINDNTIEVVSHAEHGQDSHNDDIDENHQDHFEPTQGSSGGYAKAVNVALTPGGTMTYRLRDYDAGSGATDACWANGGTLAASSVGIRGQAGGIVDAKGSVKVNGNSGIAVPPAEVQTVDTAAGNSAGYGGIGNDTLAGTIQPGNGGMIVITNNAAHGV
jgi:hypothetical protein